MRKGIFIALSILWVCFIFHNSGQSALQSSETSGKITLVFYALIRRFGIIISDVNELTLYIRKAAHVFEFFVVALFIFQMFAKCRHPYTLTLLSGLVIAGVDETIQFFTPGRIGCITDVAIDFGGVCLYVLIRAILFYIFRKKANIS